MSTPDAAFGASRAGLAACGAKSRGAPGSATCIYAYVYVYICLYIYISIYPYMLVRVYIHRVQEALSREAWVMEPERTRKTRSKSWVG